jgi:hypothetical protein
MTSSVRRDFGQYLSNNSEHGFKLTLTLNNN